MNRNPYMAFSMPSSRARTLLSEGSSTRLHSDSRVERHVMLLLLWEDLELMNTNDDAGNLEDFRCTNASSVSVPPALFACGIRQGPLRRREQLVFAGRPNRHCRGGLIIIVCIPIPQRGRGGGGGGGGGEEEEEGREREREVSLDSFRLLSRSFELIYDYNIRKDLLN
eukprot:TRINITY_DN29298_c0_g1_i2.p2 TRINITY_DN29298_c0_g1~~TRINITY_DN29298_c0_g1_i2.p2  ORF type:complete len:168 (-),score=26.99 TRINITY_DN29298_c0_g1_i2:156-659(-)